MDSLAYAKLSAQKALLGAITPALRAVTVNINEISKKIFVSFYYDGEINEELFDLTSVAIAEIDVPGYEMDDKILRVDFPETISFNGHLVYLRKE